MRFSVKLALLTLAATLLAAGSVPAQNQGSEFSTYNKDPKPEIDITYPSEGEIVPEDESVVLRYDLQGLTPKEGSYHVHVILDDQPYQASYRKSRFNLGQLEPGTHTLRIFASRGWHESFKNEGAYDSVNFHVGESDGEVWIDHGKPTLTYSRPKRGASYGEDLSDRLLIDYYLHGVTLGKDGYRVRITFDGTSYIQTTWTPMFIEDVEPGEYTVKIELLNSEGELADANFNPSQGTFTVEN